MYAGIHSVDLPNLADIVAYFSSGDMTAWCLLFSIVGLVIGLILRPEESSIVINIVCAIIGAILGGFLMLSIGAFYGRIGVLVASFAGAVVFLLVKRAIASDTQ